MHTEDMTKQNKHIKQLVLSYIWSCCDLELQPENPINSLAIHLTLLIFCSIINPQCPHALLPVSYLQFHGITYPLVLIPFVSLLRKFGTP